MRFVSNILLIAAFFKLKVRAEDGIIGNLAFFGRGQRHLPTYWQENIKQYNGSKVYFPYNESDDDNSTSDSSVKNEIIDKAKNNPLVLYLPKESALDFYVSNKDKSIDLTSFHKIKSEIKLVHPRVEDLIAENYTCSSIGLTCDNLIDYDFETNKDEWLSLVNIEFILESEDIVNDDELDEEDKEALRINITSDSKPTNKWSEYVGSIDETAKITNDIYTNFIITNSGTMPVYIFIGNTIFLKKDPTDMVINGVIQNRFENWSWYQPDNEKLKKPTYIADSVYPGDDQKNKCVKFVTKIDGDFAYYVHINNGISAPPEGISFRIRPINDNQFKFKIDNKKEFNLTSDYLVHRNCKIPIGEETRFIVDVRSIVYSDPKFMLLNDISGYWLQTISEISKIKEKIKKEITAEEGEEAGNTAADDYEDVLYFYDFTLHHTYPEDTSMYVKEKLFEDGPDCNLNLETHEDWGKRNKVNKANPVIQWPDDLSFETIFKPRVNNKELNNQELNAGEESNSTDINNSDNTSGANSVKPFITLFIISAILALFL